MKKPLLSMLLLLALSSHASAQSSAPVAGPEVAAATAFADSLAHVPNADRNDIRQAGRYAEAVRQWYSSSLAADVKRQPLAGQVWANYRAVLRVVFTSRELSYQHEVTTAKLDDYAPQCASLAKGLLSLAQFSPKPTARQAQSDIDRINSGVLNVKAAARRHLDYLQALNPVSKN